MNRALIILAGAFLLSACGVKGDLYLPEDAPSKESVRQKPRPETAKEQIDRMQQRPTQ